MIEVKAIRSKQLRDGNLLKVLKRLAELESAAREHEQLEKMVKAEMKEKGDGRYQCGPWKIEVETRTRTVYEVPQEIKDQWKTEGSAVYVSWTR